ncbi:MAG: DsbA family protein [Gammaproteobacteria bacterium]|nr:DsbA family protein [Gammaproteobacteria bacterium]
MKPTRILHYYVDPMCSWCWGFAPVMSRIKTVYADRINIALTMGGLRPGTSEAVTPQFRAEILRHWREVQNLTGQSFAFDGALPENFIYDTEPASRAVIVVAGLNPAATFAYLKSIQAAFYTQRQNVTQAAILAALAEPFEIKPEVFLAQFDAEETKKKTHTHFVQTRQAGVRGFPTLILQADSDSQLLANGYRSFEQLYPEIDAWLTATAPSAS